MVAGHMVGVSEVTTVSTPELGILLDAPDSLEQPLGVYGAGDCHPLVVHIAHHLIHPFDILKLFPHFLFTLPTAQRHHELHNRDVADGCVECRSIYTSPVRRRDGVVHICLTVRMIHHGGVASSPSLWQSRVSSPRRVHIGVASVAGRSDLTNASPTIEIRLHLFRTLYQPLGLKVLIKRLRDDLRHDALVSAKEKSRSPDLPAVCTKAQIDVLPARWCSKSTSEKKA